MASPLFRCHTDGKIPTAHPLSGSLSLAPTNLTSGRHKTHSFAPFPKPFHAAIMSGLSRLRHLSPRLLTLRKLPSRSYGSAAAQLHYDSDYDGDDDVELQQHGVVGTEGAVPGRGVQWVLIGHRGGQRHVYAERLSKLLEIPHISMGTLVRQELHPRSSFYKQVCSPLLFHSLIFYTSFWVYLRFLVCDVIFWLRYEY